MRVDQDVMQVLSAADVDGAQLLLRGQLDRKLYERTNKVLEAAGGKWNRKAKAHVFEADAAERVEQIILTGRIEVPRDEFDFFPTPLPLAETVAGKAGISAGMTLLEPSAGDGALALAAARHGATVDCIEIRGPAVIALEARRPPLRNVFSGDFMTFEHGERYDRVLMNPPFSKRRDIRHVQHAWRFVRPGGRLVAIVGAGATFRADREAVAFRELVSAHGSMAPLPEGSFKASGTGVNTALVILDKPAA